MLAAQQASSPLLANVQTWYNGLPLITKATFSLITAIYVCQLITGYDNVYGVCLSPYETVYHYQVYRLVSSVVVHGGLLHVTFNMLAFVPMACSLERLVGTVQFTYLLVLISVLEGVVYIGASFMLSVSGLVSSALVQCAIGFSGVIFGLIVIDNAQSAASQRSIFGLFNVPAVYYPWALLVFWQLLMPSVSFIGHLAGVLVGQLWVWGYLRPLSLSRPATVWLESSWPLARCVRWPSFMMMPGSALPFTTHDTRGVGGSSAGPSGSAGGGEGHSGASARTPVFGPNLASLGKLLRGGGGAGAPGSGDVEGPGGVQGSGTDAEAGSRAGVGAVFQGTGRVLGGGGVLAPPPTVPPGAAAALAAEARMGGSAAVAPRGSADKHPRS